ncbi:hypothetical protein ACJH6H_26170, partial [Mycobacterium sp. SMC-21]|uniref:hypothetical protein n=1 Tax=Mycobacterium sp. SMC-21 TaxID=3381632 RepID=UPI003875F4A7
SFSRDLDLYPGNDAPTTSTPSSVKSHIPDDKLVEQAHAFLTGKQISGALDLEEACLPDSFLD